MSRSCIQISTGQILATAFFGGLDRGKVLQLHMNPTDLLQLRSVDVYDSESELVSTLEEWINVEKTNTKMVIFDRFAEPKVSTIQVEIR